ncbi:hypothetical protein SAMN05421736_102177 [Evansella caseinilytica]|uniref:DUF2157 domain-containing protein n=1 Tax=Evansella caseinilytica TaxID=1503961 RepID=A0A1H3KLB5_9BACI|nr:hypothetical protein [Evansella caseinilytica]SDY52508.1 hypothetical protein SAMN05421736_102177 [Evansella caseinilytica]
MEQRKQIIINEIKYWKNNQLLPEVYCNFLLSLYTEGASNDDNEETKQRLPLRYLSLLTAAAVCLLALSFVVIYFTQFSPTMQISFQFLLVLICFFISAYFYRKKERIAHLYIAITTFMSFQFVIETAGLFFKDKPYAFGISVLLMCVVWLVAGWRWKITYLLIAGISGAVIFIIFLVI